MTNLPRQATSFVGREWELAEVKGLLLQPPSGCRLLTLTGPGGCGKTRLAIEVTRAVVPDYPSGVWWVSLAELADASLLPQVIAGAIGVEIPTWAAQSVGPLIEALQHKRMVLLLDTCEHLVESLAALTTALLRGCPQLQILATSREALAIAGEMTWLVPPLGLPPESVIRGAFERTNPSLSPADLARYGAIQLFNERVRAINHGLILTDQNAATIASICRRLEGIPMAIELAATQIRRLTVRELAAQLDDQLYLLENNDQATLPRHRTLNAVMDWSYALLDESERILLQHLSVFLGGWTLEAAEAVCACGTLTIGEVARCLGRLVDRSLATIDETQTLEVATPTRYRMLEIVRHYAQARLDAVSSATLRQAHADYFIRLATHAELTMIGPDWTIWLKRLEREQDNLRAARSWVQASANQSLLVPAP